ncbi:UNVERIFIED_CONTAM: spore germination protein (amino acid permease) [Acetivibrio alkalicellulosi]
MDNKIIFGRWEATSLMITMISTKAILDFPRLMLEDAASAGWLLSLYVSILALIGFILINKLYKGFSGKDILDISEIVGCAPVKILVGTILLVFLILLTSFSLRLFGELIKAMGFVVTPISFIFLFLFTGILFGAYMGIEALVRFMSIIVPITILSFGIFILAILPKTDINNIFPLLGIGPYDVFVKGSLRLSSYTELIFLFLLIPFIKTHENFKKTGFWAIGICSIVFISITIAFTNLYPYPAAIEEFFPAYQMARIIDYGRFFKRLESVLIITWATIAFMYLSTAFYFILYVFKKTFNLKYYRPLLFPFGILIFVISLLPESLLQTVEFEKMYLRNWGWTVGFALVIILLIIANILKSNKKKAKLSSS